jgi:hypothetical protein
VAKGVVTSADGRAVAQLNCGILVEAPGLVDHVGLQVGASARQVIDRHRDPEQRLTCVGGAGGETQCWFRPPADHDEPIARYTVRATPPQPVLEGREAVAFFAAQTILRFSLTMYCH